MGLVRVAFRAVGVVCFALSALFGLFALLAYLDDSAGSGLFLPGALAALAVLLTVMGFRAMNHHRASPNSRIAMPANSRQPHGRRFEDFDWGDPPPTRKQFGYAMSLGAEICHGMTKWMMSEAIDEAIENQRSSEPASKDQLQTIRRYHGVLPRSVTRGEARQAIEFLEDYSLPCPFCRIEIMATDTSCCACNKSLGRMKIPLKL